VKQTPEGLADSDYRPGGPANSSIAGVPRNGGRNGYVDEKSGVNLCRSLPNKITLSGIPTQYALPTVANMTTGTWSLGPRECNGAVLRRRQASARDRILVYLNGRPSCRWCRIPTHCVKPPDQHVSVQYQRQVDTPPAPAVTAEKLGPAMQADQKSVQASIGRANRRQQNELQSCSVSHKQY